MTATDNSTTYTVVITRGSSDATLKNIVIKDNTSTPDTVSLSLTFSFCTTSYSANVALVLRQTGVLAAANDDNAAVSQTYHDRTGGAYGYLPALILHVSRHTDMHPARSAVSSRFAPSFARWVNRRAWAGQDYRTA